MTRSLIFDIEADNLYLDATKLHSLVIRDADTGELMCSAAQDRNYHSFNEALELLGSADRIIGHNVVNYDLPTLKKLTGWVPFDWQKTTDTLVLSRMIWSDLTKANTRRMPPKLMRSHSLEAWGWRLGEQKTKAGEETTEGSVWDVWTPEMQTYCEQDTLVNWKLWKKLEPDDFSQTAIDLEHEVADVVAWMYRNGVYFNTRDAERLQNELACLREDIRHELQTVFPPWWEPGEVVMPKRGDGYNAKGRKRVENGAPPGKDGLQKTLYLQDCPYTPVELTAFNPGSRHHIFKRLKAQRGWNPSVFTPNGQAQVDETILGKLPWPEAKALARFFLVEKRLGQVAEGEQAWLKAVRSDGRIHGSIIPSGTVSRRCSHRGPNLAQVPKVKVHKTEGALQGEKGLWGWECRSLFGPPPGFVQVGADLSGIELRCLAHYMARWDNGDYAKVLLEGDIHSVNQRIADLPTRDDAKTFIYAMLYGAGDAKLGQLKKGGPKVGKQLRERFMTGLPAYGSLVEAVHDKVPRGYLLGLDGGRLHVRSKHSSLNVLLQSAGALIADRWITYIVQMLRDRGLTLDWDGTWKGDVGLMLWVHDEVQAACRPEHVETVKAVCIEAAAKAGEFFNFRLPVAAEAKHGANWAWTH